MMDGPVLDLHAYLFTDVMLAGRITVTELASYHSAYDAVFIDVMTGIVDSLDG